jgi:hypothetical protein
MEGYCWRPNISSPYPQLQAQWLAGLLSRGRSNQLQLTEVVLTPESNLGVAGGGAGGVSIHSKLSSIMDLLIVAVVVEF